MRRTGRTTKLIVKAISELLETGETVFTDHEKEDGTRDYPSHYFKDILDKIFAILTVLLEGANPKDVWVFEIKGKDEIRGIDGRIKIHRKLP